MKKTLLLIVALLFTVSMIFAQEAASPKKHEIGITFSSLNNFGMVYKTGKKNTLFRARLLALNLQVSNTDNKNSDSERKSTGYGAGICLGFEKRISIVKNLSFVAGLDAGIQYIYSKWNNKGDIYSSEEDARRWTIRPTVNAVIGFAYTIKEALVISAELYPAVAYSFTREKGTSNGNDYETTGKNFEFGFTNSSTGITIAYRFGK